MKIVAIVGLAAVLGAGQLAAAAPVSVINETFDGLGTGGLSIFSFSGTGGLSVSNGRLQVTGQNGARFGTTAFSPVSLGVGDAMSFSFRIQADYSGGGIPGFRMGIYNSGTTQVNGPSDGAAAADDSGLCLGLLSSGFYSGVLFDDGAGTLIRDSGEAGGFIGAAPFVGESRTYELQLTRLTTDRFRTAVLQNGVITTASEFARPYTSTFDNIQFGFFDNTLPDRVFLDDVNVTYTAVPEPGAIGMLGMTAGGLLRRRR